MYAFYVKLELSTAEFTVQFCLARSIETWAECFSVEFSNLAQAHITCRVLCFVLSITGKTLATFLVVHYAVYVNLL